VPEIASVSCYFSIAVYCPEIAFPSAKNQSDVPLFSPQRHERPAAEHRIPRSHICVSVAVSRLRSKTCRLQDDAISANTQPRRKIRVDNFTCSAGFRGAPHIRDTRRCRLFRGGESLGGLAQASSRRHLWTNAWQNFRSILISITV